MGDIFLVFVFFIKCKVLIQMGDVFLIYVFLLKYEVIDQMGDRLFIIDFFAQVIYSDNCFCGWLIRRHVCIHQIS